MANMMQIDPSIEYTSTYDGTYHIIKDLGYFDDNQRKVLIKFDKTGFEQEARLYRALNGKVRDHSRYEHKPGEIFSSNGTGDLELIECLGTNGTEHLQWKIRFILTGYECIATLSNITRGAVKDPYYPSVCGVGCIGVKYNSKHPAYSIWHDMIRRCYSTSDAAYPYYGAIGVTVCDRWKCFENFVDDIQTLPGYDKWASGEDYELDKDYLQQNIVSNMKVYSPSTCWFVPSKYNKYIMIQQINSSKDTYSRYIGVGAGKNNHNYRAAITVNGSKIHLGTYDSEIAAATVYNNRAKFYKGESAVLNELPYQMNSEQIKRHRTSPNNMIKIIKPSK